MSWNKTSKEQSREPLKRDTKRSGVIIGIGGFLAICVVFLWFCVSLTREGGGSSHQHESKLKKDINIKKEVPRQIDVRDDVSQETGKEKERPIYEGVKKEKATRQEVLKGQQATVSTRHHIVSKMPIVKAPAEQLMLSIFETELGDPPPQIPMLPQVDEEAVLATIEKMHTVNADDSEETAQAKTLINNVKKELKVYLEEGGNINSFLQYYCSELQRAYDERVLYCQDVINAIKTEQRDVAQELYLQMNEKLNEKGIKPISLSRKQREYLGIVD